MALMIAENRSSEAHENIGNRHQRLCQRTRGAEPLVNNISPVIAALADKRVVTLERRQHKEECYDALLLVNGEMDDGVRTVFEKCKQFDRQNPGSNVLLRIFPTGRTSDIISVSLYDEAMKVDQLITRIKSLSGEHPMLESIQPLQEVMNKELEAQRIYREAVGQWKLAVAEEDLAKADLRRQYEHNYLDAVKLFGKRFAQRLFPKVTKSRPVIEDPEAAVEIKSQVVKNNQVTPEDN